MFSGASSGSTASLRPSSSCSTPADQPSCSTPADPPSLQQPSCSTSSQQQQQQPSLDDVEAPRSKRRNLSGGSDRYINH